MAWNFIGAAKRIDDLDIPRIGAKIGVGEDEVKEPAHEQHGYRSFDGIADDGRDGGLESGRAPGVGSARAPAAYRADVHPIHPADPQPNRN